MVPEISLILFSFKEHTETLVQTHYNQYIIMYHSTPHYIIGEFN